MHHALAIALAALLLSGHAEARRRSHHREDAASEPARSHSTRSHSSRSHGHRSRRDPAQRREFMRQHPCPSTGRTSGACPGYVVDHIKALKRGGADRPSNMQWQSIAEAKAKDRWE